MAETDGVAVLVMRDMEGNLYLLDDKAIQSCRAIISRVLPDGLVVTHPERDLLGPRGPRSKHEDCA